MAHSSILHQMRPNPRSEGTAEKLRFSVPSLRSAAPQTERWGEQAPASRALSLNSQIGDDKSARLANLKWNFWQLRSGECSHRIAGCFLDPASKEAPIPPYSVALFLVVAWALGGAGVAQSQIVIGAGSSMSLGSGVVDLGCVDLDVAGSLQLGSAQLVGIRDASIMPSGVLGGEAGAIFWSRDWSNDGQWQPGTSSASWVDGCRVTVATMDSNNQQFYSLAMLTDTGREVRFTSGQTTEVSAGLTINGAAGQLLRIRSTSPGSRGFLNLLSAASESVSHLDVADNQAVGQPIGFPGPASNYDSIKGANSTGWFELAAMPEPVPVPVPSVSMGGLLLLGAAMLVILWRRLTAAGSRNTV